MEIGMTSIEYEKFKTYVDAGVSKTAALLEVMGKTTVEIIELESSDFQDLNEIDANIVTDNEGEEFGEEEAEEEDENENSGEN